jgi:hypothetical protein
MAYGSAPSPTGTILAGEDLSTHRGRCMTLNASGRWVRAAAGASCYGILNNAPASGEEALVHTQRGILVEAISDTAIDPNDELIVGADGGVGNADLYAEGNIVALAVGTAGASGEFLTILFLGYDGEL